MVEEKVRRKLAAILSADVVGYSKLMSDDEAATVETISKYRAEIESIVNRHEGRVVNAPGDNILAEFVSAVEAVQAAVEIQSAIETLNAGLPEHRQMHFRIGLNLGDVIEKQDGTIYGDGVNIAARMEALADTGGICVSNSIQDAVRGKLDFGFEFLGERSVKNIDEPVRVYRVTAQLVDAKDGTHLWAQTFDRDLTIEDLFEIQDEITSRVAGTIADSTGIITLSQLDAIREKPTESLVAYECVLLGLRYYDITTESLHREVRDCLERTVELDPNYADAWAILGYVYVDESRFGFNPQEGSLDRALNAAKESVRLDARGEFGQHALAMVHFHRQELDDFNAAADRAIEHNPNHPYALADIAEKYFFSGRWSVDMP